jgi:hypothetical protein
VLWLVCVLLFSSYLVFLYFNLVIFPLAFLLAFLSVSRIRVFWPRISHCCLPPHLSPTPPCLYLSSWAKLCHLFAFLPVLFYHLVFKLRATCPSALLKTKRPFFSFSRRLWGLGVQPYECSPQPPLPPMGYEMPRKIAKSCCV